MIITDADAKVAEIYVCKLLNIEVIEIQHGVIFKNESGYTWDKSYKKITKTLYYQYRMK